MSDHSATTTDAAHSPDRASAEPRRLLFYSHDGTGLGHLRIVLAVASAYAALRPQDSLLLLTGSLQVGSFAIPANLDFVKLPAMPKRDLYASLPPTEGFTGSHNSTIRFRSSVALTTTQAFDPHLVVVDHAPAGLFRELAPTLEWLLGRSSRPQLALLMRDITFGPEQTRTIWKNEGVIPLLERAYDRILIYGSKAVFDPIAAYGLSAAVAARGRFCGYLAPALPKRSPESLRHDVGAGDLPLVVVSVGGGADGGALLRAYLAGLREKNGPPIYSYVVTGPLLPESDRQAVIAQAADLPNVRVTEFDADFAAAVRAADVVVSMGGYNSLTEAVYFGKRPIVAPRLAGPEEQVLRSNGFARLDLATVIEAADLNPEKIWQAVEDELGRPPPPGEVVPFGGLDCIAGELASLALADSTAPLTTAVPTR